MLGLGHVEFYVSINKLDPVHLSGPFWRHEGSSQILQG